MKKRILILASALLLTGCAKGYSPVTKENNNTKVEISGDFSYCRLDELEQDFENVKSGKYDKLKLDSGLKINIPNELCSYNVIEEGASRELGKKLIDEYGFTDLCTVSDDDESVFLVNYSAAKQITLRKDGLFACHFSYDEITENNDLVYFRNVNIDKDTSAILKTAQSFMDGYSSLIDSVSLIPLYLNNSNGASQIFFSRDINGFFQPCYLVNDIDKGAINTDLFYGVWIQGEIVVSDDGTVSSFTDNNGKTEIKSVNEIYDEIISASSAISFVDKSIADNMECKVDDVSLVQMRQYSENERAPKDIKELDQSNNDSEYVMHPYWQVMMTSIKTNDKRYVALVDCITGEFAFTSII